MRSVTLTMAVCLLALAKPSMSAHDVTLRVESLTSTPVTFRVTLRSAPATRPDSVTKLSELTYTSPVQLVVGADVSEVQIATEQNRAVTVTFQAGGSTRERAQRVWGRQLLLRRSQEGDLMSEARAMMIVPAK